MEIILNGEKETLDKEYTIITLLEKYELSPDIVTISLNGDILVKEAFASTLVKSGDAVDILMFMGGGH